MQVGNSRLAEWLKMAGKGAQAGADLQNLSMRRCPPYDSS
jgi:hypothetical protein